jgi:hypothetical protein
MRLEILEGLALRRVLWGRLPGTPYVVEAVRFVGLLPTHFCCGREVAPAVELWDYLCRAPSGVYHTVRGPWDVDHPRFDFSPIVGEPFEVALVRFAENATLPVVVPRERGGGNLLLGRYYSPHAPCGDNGGHVK